jgi:hypothetical protein
MFFQNTLPNAGAPTQGPGPNAVPARQQTSQPPPNLAALLALLQHAGGMAPSAPTVRAPAAGSAAAARTAPSPVLAATQPEDQVSHWLRLLKSFLPPQSLVSGLDAGGASAPVGARHGMRQP